MPTYGLQNDSGAGLILVKTALDKLLGEGLEQETREGRAFATDPIIFTQATATRAAEVTSALGGGGYFKKISGGKDVSTTKEVAKSAPAPKTTLMAEFKKDLDISRTFMADQQHDAVAIAVKQDARTWIASQDQNAFYGYGNGFTTTTTIDGVALFANNHVNNNGDTISNIETGAMSDANLNIAVVALRGQLNLDGVKIGYEPDFILVSSQGHHDAIITAKSVLKAGGGDNDLNYFSELYPGAKVVYNHFLDDLSTTAYFIGAKNHAFMRFERESLSTTIVPWQYDDNDMYKYKMRAREEVDAITYVALVGSNGTTS